jgi:hypothetical protein
VEFSSHIIMWVLGLVTDEGLDEERSFRNG